MLLCYLWLIVQPFAIQCNEHTLPSWSLVWSTCKTHKKYAVKHFQKKSNQISRTMTDGSVIKHGKTDAYLQGSSIQRDQGTSSTTCKTDLSVYLVK